MATASWVSDTWGNDSSSTGSGSYGRPVQIQPDFGGYYAASNSSAGKTPQGFPDPPGQGTSTGIGTSTGTGTATATGTPTQWNYGTTATPEGLAAFTNYLADIFGPMSENAVWGIGEQQNQYNNQQQTMNDWINKYNAQQEQLLGLNSKINTGYDQMQSYFPQIGDAYSQMVGFMPKLNNLLGGVETAAGGLQQAYDQMRTEGMDAVRAAYQGVLNGTVPPETARMIQERYDTGMAQIENELNRTYQGQQADLLDNLGARGILNSSTSGTALTGLGSNLQNAIGNASSTLTIEQINTLLNEPYKILDAATKQLDSYGNVVNAGAQNLAGANSALQGGLGVHGAYGDNFNAALNQYGAANQGFNSLLNSVGTQYQLGQSPLTNLQNLFNMNQGSAGLASNITDQSTAAAQNIWSQLLNAETARLTSGNASSGGSSSSSIWGPILGDVVGGIFGGLF